MGGTDGVCTAAASVRLFTSVKHQDMTNTTVCTERFRTFSIGVLSLCPAGASNTTRPLNRAFRNVSDTTSAERSSQREWCFFYPLCKTEEEITIRAHDWNIKY